MQRVVSHREITGRRKFYRDIHHDAKAYVALSSAKSRLMLRHPFWGFMGLDLVLVEVPGVEIRTLCTDGYHIFYNAAFINRLRPGEVEFAVAHEVYHCLFGHTGGEGLVNRRGDRDPKLWNYATDYVINADLREFGVGEFITTIRILYDIKYKGWAAEQVYDDLVKNPPPADAETLDVHVEFETSGDETGDGEPTPGQSGDPKDGESGNEEPQEGGSGSSKGGGPSDRNEGSGGAEKDAEGNLRIKVSKEYMEDEAARWAETANRATAHIETSGEDAGSIPEHLKRLIRAMSEPKLDWRPILRRFVFSVIRTGYSYLRPDKKSFNTGISLPGFRRTDQKLAIAVAIDTSGSISDDALGKFLGELFGILKSYPVYEVHAFCFEGDVDESTYKVIRSTNKSPKDDLMEYAKHVNGGGGTAFHSVWHFLRKKRIKPRGLVFFTDGYPCDDSWTRESGYCPTMFVTVGNQSNWKAPFGATVAYEDFG